MKAVTRSAFFFLVLSLLGRVHFLFAQGTDLGTIRGTVKDARGTVIADAKVIVPTSIRTPRG
jgi:hypothetical protein